MVGSFKNASITYIQNVKVHVKQTKYFPRNVLEASNIKKKGPTLNRDTGLELDPVWDNLLLNKDGKEASRHPI